MGKKVTPGHIAFIAKSVLSAIHHLRLQNIMHNDIKPENLVVTLGGGVKLIDFSSASLAGDCVGRVGTVMYMAPEVLADNISYDSRADVFSLGLTLVNILMGGRMGNNYDQASWETMLNSEEPFPFQRMFKAEMDGDMQVFLSLALEKDQDKRPYADELLQHQFLGKYIHESLIAADDMSLDFGRRFDY